MKLIDEYVCPLSLLPVQRHAVQHGICDHQQACRLQLSPKSMDVEHNHTLIEIHVALLAKNVEGTRGIQLQGQCNLLCFRFRLLKQLFAQCTERWDRRGFICLPVYLSNTAVNNGFVLRPNTFFVDLLYKRHDELRLDYDRVVLAIAINHIHSIKPVSASSGYPDHRTEISHRFNERCVLAFRITNQDVIIRIQDEESDQFLHAERLTGSGNTKNKRRLVQQVFLIAHNQVVRDGILTEVNATLIHNLLDFKRDEYSQTLSSQCTESINLSCSNGKHGVQAV